MNALFGSICIKYIHIVCVQTNTEVFPSVSNHNSNKILKSDWLSTALISAYVSCLNNWTVRAIRRALKWNLSCFDHNYSKILNSDWLSTALISAYVSCLNNRTVHAITGALKWNFSCFGLKKSPIYHKFWDHFTFFHFSQKSKMIQILLKLWLTGNRTSCHPFRSVIILVIKQIGLLHHSYVYRPNWTLLSPVTITNSLICIPYPRVNCLKTIPFTAAHTCIVHIWQSPRGFSSPALQINCFRFRISSVWVSDKTTGSKGDVFVVETTKPVENL